MANTQTHKTLPRNDFGKTCTVEECRIIRISHLLKQCRAILKRVLLEAEIEAMGASIELTTSTLWHGGIRFWFKCPICQKRVGVIYEQLITSKICCRGCLGLDYAKQRYKGMVEAEALKLAKQ